MEILPPGRQGSVYFDLSTRVVTWDHRDPVIPNSRRVNDIVAVRNMWFLKITSKTWWCHQMETFSALLAICAGNSPVTGEFPAHSPHKGQRREALMFLFFYLCLNIRLRKQSWGWWLETLSRPLWCHCKVIRQVVASNKELQLIACCKLMSQLPHVYRNHRPPVWIKTSIVQIYPVEVAQGTGKMMNSQKKISKKQII